MNKPFSITEATVTNRTTRPEISIVVPAYNEAANIPVLVSEVLNVLGPGADIEILVVNDGSRDETAETLKTMAEKTPELRYITFSRNFGHQAALLAGLRNARGACAIAMDADLQHPPEFLPMLIDAWRDGAALVLTRRDDRENVSLFKKISSSAFYKFVNVLGDFDIEPGSADFFLLDRKVLRALNQFGESRIFLRGILPTLGYEKQILDYSPADRRHGASKYTLRKMISLGLDGILSTSINPLRLGTIAAMALGGLASIYALYAIYVAVVLKTALPGWTSVMLVVTIIGAIQLFVLGVIGEYLGRALTEVRGRPAYIVAETNIEALAAEIDGEETVQ
ncbi:MAG: glycosyltransferase family 2 protein [Marinicaulis sp.]|nr:glycosyltransferase family 2 protein [Marinicaulis sp.]